MNNETENQVEDQVEDSTTDTETPVEEKKMGSGEWMRLQLMHGWDNPESGHYPADLVKYVIDNWNTGKTKINDLYFQANKLRKDDPDGYGDLKIRDYIKRIEDADGTTQRATDDKELAEMEKAEAETRAKEEIAEKEAKAEAKKAEAETRKAEKKAEKEAKAEAKKAA